MLRARSRLTVTLALCALSLTACWSEPEPDPLIASPGPGCWLVRGAGAAVNSTYAVEIGADGGTSLSARGDDAPGPAWTQAELDLLMHIASPRGDMQVRAVKDASGRDEVTREEATFQYQTLRTKLLTSPPC